MITWGLCVVLMLMHVGFGIAEMFYWRKLGPSLAKNRDRCGLDEANMKRAIDWSGFMAFNQGVYNLFLAAGFYVCLAPGMTVNDSFVHFFSTCVIVAGLAGWYCGIKTVLYVQTLPGLLLLVTALYGI